MSKHYNEFIKFAANLERRYRTLRDEISDVHEISRASEDSINTMVAISDEFGVPINRVRDDVFAAV